MLQIPWIQIHETKMLQMPWIQWSYNVADSMDPNQGSKMLRNAYPIDMNPKPCLHLFTFIIRNWRISELGLEISGR